MTATRFRTGLAWNLVAVGLLGVSGFLLNVLIGRYYGPAAFGVFTQVLAYYYVFSQLAVGGLGYSTVSLTARFSTDVNRLQSTIFAALMLTLALSAASTGAAIALSGPIGSWADSADVSSGILWSLPGLVCFALNKVLLFALNGLGHMRAHAVFTSLRYVLIIVILAVQIWSGATSPQLAFALSGGELILFPVLATYAFRKGILRPIKVSREYLREHWSFARRSFFTPLLQDATTKVDVVVLGIFADDFTVGLYAFAAMLAIEGAYQILYVVQINLSPMLSALPVDSRPQLLAPMYRRATLYLVPAMLVIGVIGTALFPVVARVLTGDAAFSAGWTYFGIIMVGLAVSAARLPFGVALNQWGMPGAYFTLALFQFSTNAILNVGLVPLFGGIGAAIGSALSFILAAGFVHFAISRFAATVN